MKRWLWILVTLAGLCPTVARATVGGPDRCEVLGWDAHDMKVYVLRHNESDQISPYVTLVYFDLKSREPCRPVIVPWSREDAMMESTSDLSRRLSQIRKRLRPLRLVSVPDMPVNRVVAADTLERAGDATSRFQVDVQDQRMGKRWFRVTTYHSRTVNVPQIYEIPGGRGRIGVLSFIGIPNEGGYESQVPVLAGSSCRDTLLVEWKGYGN